MPTLHWIGKDAVVGHHHAVPFRLLRDEPTLACGAPGSGNLLVEGDNLLALKALLPRYAGRVKCIYIDPPYNTGNEGWVYNDAVNAPTIKDWLGKTVGKEAEDLCRHDKWLCMMYPRLALLREFLRDDGSIWVTLDDNEISSLRLIMDEIFGADNFVATVVWQKKYATANDHKTICPMHDYAMVYRKSAGFKRNLLPRTEEKDRQYRMTDQGGVFRPDNYTCNKNSDERPNLYYAITNPNTGEEIWPKRTAVWRYSKERHAENIANDLVYWGKDGKGKVPAFKRYRESLIRGGGTVPPTWWTHEFAGHTDGARKDFRDILGTGAHLDFATPKPKELLERILQIASNPGDLILDSFAGSGTTAHAVLKLNAENPDKPPRQFIAVEMESKIAREITAERIRRVASGYTNAKGEAVAGLGGAFRYCTLGEELFDAEGGIRREVSFEELARFVWFTATGEPFPHGVPVPYSPLLGVHSDGTAIYLLYNGVLDDLSPGGGNILTRDLLAKLPAHAGQRIVYAAGCRLSPETLARAGILFRKTPTALNPALPA